MGQGPNTNRPFLARERHGTLSGCKESNVVLMVQDASAGAMIDAALSSGALCCPSCKGRLQRWGFARGRIVRRRGLPALRLRPPRVRCSSCGITHVLLSASCLPRRLDEVATIGAALLAHVRGEGHRPIAVRLELPPDTVRGWLRRARSNHASLRYLGTVLAHSLDANLPPLQPAGSPLGDAIDALATAAAAAQRFFGGSRTPWEAMTLMTHGRLLAPGGP